MARFHMGEEENYGGKSGSSYFAMKEDGEVKKVRFMYKDSNDVVGYAVHEVMVNGKKRYVNCLRDYGSPVDDCPLCKAGYRVLTKMYVPVYDEALGQATIWERGKKFMSKMSSICARFPNVVSHVFEIERHGAKGSTDTTYDIYEVGNDEKTLNDLPEVPEVLGKVILDKNAEEMNAYLRNGDFPYNATPKREDVDSTQSTSYSNPVPQRRVPADNGKDRF